MSGQPRDRQARYAASAPLAAEISVNDALVGLDQSRRPLDKLLPVIGMPRFLASSAKPGTEALGNSVSTLTMATVYASDPAVSCHAFIVIDPLLEMASEIRRSADWSGPHS